MLRRKIYDRLVQWKNGSSRKPLVITGSRQVGKTFIVREFAEREYAHFVEFNFSLDEEVKLAFAGNLRVDDILNALSVLHDSRDFVPGSTLIFFDEIQCCSRAWTSLKAFAEDGRYDVIACCSMLGIERNMDETGRKPLLPTGYQNVLEMKPLDFEEFLWASGIAESQIDLLKESLRNRQHLHPALHLRFSDLFREYRITGGMPRVVSEYVEKHDVASGYRALDDLMKICHQDIIRFNTNVNGIKTRDCFDSIPHQLSQVNKKFMYSRVKGKGSRKSAEKYYGNLLWIKYSGLGICCNALTQPASPLMSNTVPDVFRIYLSDTGLLTHQYGLPAVAAIRAKDDAFNCGAVLENQVAVCLDHCGYPIRFYRKNDGPSKMELDFVIETGSGIVIVEVKSGKDRDAPSIRKIDRFFEVDHRVMLEDSQYSLDDDGIEHFPLYAAAFFDGIWDDRA